MKTATQFAACRNQTNDADVSVGYPVPHVLVYVTQLYFLLYASLNHRNFVVDIDLFNPSSTNLIITNHRTQQSVVLICLAHGPDLQVYNQQKRGAPIYKGEEYVKELWILNFSTLSTKKVVLLPLSEDEERPLRAIHIHLHGWIKGEMLYDGIVETLELQK